VSGPSPGNHGLLKRERCPSASLPDLLVTTTLPANESIRSAEAEIVEQCGVGRGTRTSVFFIWKSAHYTLTQSCRILPQIFYLYFILLHINLARDMLRTRIGVERFRALRHEALPLAEAAGYISDEDIFRDIS